jgi:splicing factor 1
MEKESGAKIAIRGKGSVKEGKGRSDAAHTSNQEEDLHCLIMADTEDKVNKAKQLINNIIETAASIPEGQNELKRNQLRELAALNGTLRDDENQACGNCKYSRTSHINLSNSILGGEIGHRKFDCPEKEVFNANITCRTCGNAGHFARDCPERKPGQNWRNDGPPVRPPPRINGSENDYSSLMDGPGGDAAPRRLEYGGAGGPGYDQPAPYAEDDGRKPWERGPAAGGFAPYDATPTGGAAPWSAGPPRPQNYGYGIPSTPNSAPGAAAPWGQQHVPPPPGAGYGYQGQGQGQGYGYPPGPPGQQPYMQQGMGYGIPPPPANEAPPPPPMHDAPPPPPPSDLPPPPPPGM